MPQPPKNKRSSRLNCSPEHAEKVKQAEAELAQKIEGPLMGKNLWLGLLGTLIMLPIFTVLSFVLSLIRGGIVLSQISIVALINWTGVSSVPLLVQVGIVSSQIYAIIVGSSIIWSGISSVLNGQPSFTYHAGSFNPLPLFQFNPGLGNVYFGWGVLLSVLISWGKAQENRLSLMLAFIFGLATFITGLMNLCGVQVDIGMRISGLFGFLLSLLIGFSLVVTVLTAWKKTDGDQGIRNR